MSISMIWEWCSALKLGFGWQAIPIRFVRRISHLSQNSNIPEQEPKDGFWPGAPDLAVEVLSPGDRAGEVDEKIDAWLAAGCAAVWIVNPKLKTVTVYRSRTDVQVKAAGDMLHGDPVVPGFSCSVDELFR